jgi:hypothetical protein
LLHTRVYTGADDLALANLSGCQYKTLRYLVNRADTRGICYPGIDRISAETGYNERHSRRALDILWSMDLIRFVRKDERDPVTRQQLPNAYQVNPDYICLAAGAESEARAIWSSLIVWCGNDSVGLRSPTNQQPKVINQQQRTNVSDPAPITNTNNQRSPKADAPRLTTGKGKKKDIDGEASQRAAPDNQRNAPAVEPGSAPAKFANPKNIYTPLDEWHEPLAQKLRGLGIPFPMARGFVQEYGFDRCQAALLAVGEAVLNATADRPGGLFRSILQRNLADEEAARAAAQYIGYREPDVDDPGF